MYLFQILNYTGGVVALTLVINASTIEAVLKKLGELGKLGTRADNLFTTIRAYAFSTPIDVKSSNNLSHFLIYFSEINQKTTMATVK